ncbi:MAG: ABC transporter permease [Nocardioidaceae bacterium]
MTTPVRQPAVPPAGRPAGTFAPRPGAASLAVMVRAQARMETRLLLRNGEQLLIAVAIPLIVLVGGIAAAQHLDLSFSHRAVDTLTPGVLALAVMSTSFTSLAIATGFERRYGVLKRLGASPLPRSGLLAGKVGALLVVEAVQLVVIGAAALLLGWAPQPGVTGVLGALVVTLLGTAAFASLGLLLAGTLRAEATLAAANLVYLLLLAGGAVVFPSGSYGAAGPLLSLLPSGALGAGMRTAFLDGAFPTWPLAVLAAWAAVGTVVTARTFRWE